MFKYILSFCFSLTLFSAYAHQADISSTVLVEQDNDIWVLQIKASLTAFQYEVKNKHGVDPYATPEEFQDLVLRHVKDNVSILLDETKQVVLQDGMVILGHETSVVFKVIGIPEKFHKVNFTNSSFKNIMRNKSAFIILKKGFGQKQFILNNQNNHTAKLIAKDAQFTEMILASSTDRVRPKYFVGLAGILIIGLLFFLNKKIGYI